MKPLIYLPAGPEVWNLDLNPESVGIGHFKSTGDALSFLWPAEINQETVSPQALRQLKNHLTIDTLWLIDRAKGIKSPVYVCDHMNRSGTNFLIGKTFSEEGPTFPDSGDIYSLPENRSGRIVVSVGTKRFNETEKINAHPLCEWVGSIAPVWSYVDVKVVAVAAPSGTGILSFLIHELKQAEQ